MLMKTLLNQTLNVVFYVTFKDRIVSMSVEQPAGQAIIKIILHRIISVVWLTNFLSEILTQSAHDDELNSSLWAWRGDRPLADLSHWWSLTLLWGRVEGELSSEWWCLSSYRIVILLTTTKQNQSGTLHVKCILNVSTSLYKIQNVSTPTTYALLKYRLRI